MAGKKGFMHMVFFWLKDTSPTGVEKLKGEIHAFCDQIDVIKSYHVGTPADTHRPVVFRSYEVCLVVELENLHDHDIYQDHPAHQKFVKECANLWDNVMIYDSDNN